MSCVVGAYAAHWLSLLIKSVIRVNPHQTAIASCSGHVSKWSWILDWYSYYSGYSLSSIEVGLWDNATARTICYIRSLTAQPYDQQHWWASTRM